MNNVDNELSDWESQLEQEVQKEIRQNDPVYKRFNVAYFTSKTKGKSKKRKHWKEVRLIQDTYHPKQPWVSDYKFPYDVIATEVFPYARKDEAEQQLINAIEAY